MNIENRKIWQQACGDTDREYSKTCLKWDVILIGPGYAGRYPECDEQLKNDGWKTKKRNIIRRFACDMQNGDLVVLRIGTKYVLGVGEIVGDYEWLECFGDVDGWDLQHVRRVRWLWKHSKLPQKFNTYDLKLGDTTQELTSEEVKKWLRELVISDEKLNRALIELPKAGREVTQQQIGEHLFDKGVSSNAIEKLMTEFDELKRIAKWYQNENAPSEFETVAYLVVPLLRAIGWTPQKMAIEWNNVDIALFDQLPRENENLSIVVEAKKKGNSCLTAKGQAKGYAEGKVSCKRLIVTDGLRYGVHLKTGDEYKMEAYFNLTDLKDSYPIYKCAGVKEALSIMTPDWREQKT